MLRDQDLGSLVRKIVIRLPPDLDLDECSSSVAMGRRVDSVSLKEVKSEMVTPRSLLREVFLSCVGLMVIDVSGVNPTMLFEGPVISKSRQSLQYSSNPQMASITFLSLKASSTSSPITPTKLRSAILCLCSLRTLIIKGYQSFPNSVLSFAPSVTNQAGLATRKLPSRAIRSRIVRLKIEDSSFDASDLSTLLAFVGKDLRSLCIEEVFRPQKDGRKIPTAIGLVECGAKGLLREVTTLELSLSNYSPPAIDFMATASIFTPSRTLHNAFPTHPHSFDLIEQLLPCVPLLETLRIGGPICTSKLLDDLPPSVRHLILVDCIPLDSSIVRHYLEKLALSRRRDASQLSKVGEVEELSRGEMKQGEVHQSRLRKLEVLGGSTSGWKRADEVWRVQKACWDAGIAWKGWL